MKKTEKEQAAAKLREIVKTRLDDPRLAEVAYHFIDLCGGAKGFAKLLYEEFAKTEAGGIAKQRYLDMVIRCLKVANEQDPKTGDLSLLSEEDLDREVAARMESVYASEVQETESAATGT